MIKRFSSRREKIQASFLGDRLTGALSYDRIAGYFSSSILEVAGEAIENMQGKVRVICNSDLNPRDVVTARAAQYAMRREWCAFQPEKLGLAAHPRFARLYEFLRSGKMEVKVLPRQYFGLIHGKAGVITLADGRETSFMGSANETREAWTLNYELVWEDDSPEGIRWVQEEFDALWTSPFAVPLGQFIIEDVERIARRSVVHSIDRWRDEGDPAAPVIESPVYRQEYGLWEHQKYFVKLAFDAHRGPWGARFVLADMVGLGKTVQLALSAQLMALYGDKPVLIIVPKTLLWQWQGEMTNLLDMPSAVWTGRQWVDENGIYYPDFGPQGIRKCPRQVGIISQGLITAKSEAVEYLKVLTYECVIVDEVHRARRRNLGKDKENEKPDPNNLLAFMLEIAPRTKSLLLGTATPVQMYPVEAWDLLNVLAQGNDFVLGNDWSPWRKQVKEVLNLVMGRTSLPEEESEQWQWIRNPFPPASEGIDFDIIRRSLGMPVHQAVIPGDAWGKMSLPDQARIKKVAKTYMQNHNPFIRHIIRRTREYLENTINPEINEPYLKPVYVKLFGESDQEAIKLPPYLADAYKKAEEFCEVLGKRVKSAGFLKTLLLRRLGSTIYAGRITGESMLENWHGQETGASLYEAEEEMEEQAPASEIKNLTLQEKQLLQEFVEKLKINQDRDPKYQVVWKCLMDQGWLELGCIIFSQFYDSILWLAENLSAEMPVEKMGIYAGGARSGIFHQGMFTKTGRDDLKQMVATGEIRLLLGTDAASEGLNLQRLGTLINLDLPWNPTRLEQRKGRIQRIGQLRDTVYIYNMRYQGSVEDKVHHMLSGRLEEIFKMFGQLPDILEDVWINVALGEIEKAQQTIDAVPQQHPFEIRYHHLEKVPWESCSEVLDSAERKRHLMRGW